MALNHIVNDTDSLGIMDARSLLRMFQQQNGGALIDDEEAALLPNILAKIADDSNGRHIQRATFAAKTIPKYKGKHKEIYSGILGFDRQGLDRWRIKPETIFESAYSNLYAAADHVYITLGALRGKILESMNADDLSEVLSVLEASSARILDAELTLTRDGWMRLYSRKIGLESFDGISFSDAMPDRSYVDTPHWKCLDQFHDYFDRQQMFVSEAARQTGLKPSMYPNLADLMGRLDVYT